MHPNSFGQMVWTLSTQLNFVFNNSTIQILKSSDELCLATGGGHQNVKCVLLKNTKGLLLELMLNFFA